MKKKKVASIIDAFKTVDEFCDRYKPTCNAYFKYIIASCIGIRFDKGKDDYLSVTYLEENHENRFRRMIEKFDGKIYYDYLRDIECFYIITDDVGIIIANAKNTKKGIQQKLHMFLLPTPDKEEK